MRDTVRDAFLAARGKCSPDVVIADPDLNSRFLSECRERGLSDAPVALNLCLFNLRKGGGLQGIESKRTTVNNQDEYCFASEIAVRFLERRDRTSLDQILCDPAKATEFDQIAADLAPGFSRFQYRWAALSLRKRRMLRPELLAKVVEAEEVVTRRAADVVLGEVPVRAGLYLLIGPSQVLYVGECQNLRKRVGKHLDHSDSKELALWLWQFGMTDLRIEYHVLPAGVSGRVRKAMEAELIHSRKPVFNIAGTGR